MCSASPTAQTTPATPAVAVSTRPLRAIGPALMGRRIADVAVHPRDRTTW
jgi:hypothetical protein